MRTPTPIEQRLLKTQQELQDCPHLTVNRSLTGELGQIFEKTPALFGYLPEWDGVVLSSELCVNSPRISELANHWWSAPGADLPELGGEFRITDLFSAVIKHPPDLIPSGWPGAELCSELRVIDNTPLTAAGQLAAIRIQRHTDPLEIWYYDMDMNEVEGWGRQLVRLDLTYTGYLERLVLTKGTYGWQYLFTDEVPFTDPYFKDIRTGLGAMLDHFPGLFPTWDYTDLRRRFAARFD
ncbi:hypothetical protein FCH28_13665 [Streptomyces piniterrae]|uniref:Uncharacterized protein n=1 Tax=Streptomyces piniterrae TaxID=2571125 RepID=A0A4U0NJG8_9ACTN|nr:hypothetical protein [Streptomyces piniterrae]TJZ54223.1 hypothetical protein FCH28_13665 [Streptomyces piniterrae]